MRCLSRSFLQCRYFALFLTSLSLESRFSVSVLNRRADRWCLWFSLREVRTRGTSDLHVCCKQSLKIGMNALVTASVNHQASLALTYSTRIVPYVRPLRMDQSSTPSTRGA